MNNPLSPTNSSESSWLRKTFRRLTPGCLIASSVLSGCMPFFDNVWQPGYEGAQSFNTNSCGAGGADTLKIHVTDHANILLHPVYIDRNNSLVFSIQIAAGATLRMASDEVQIETAGGVLVIPMEYQGPLEEITPQHDQHVYELVGRQKVYVFHVPLDRVQSNQFILIIPIITNSDTLDMLQVRFRRHRAVGFTGTC